MRKMKTDSAKNRIFGRQKDGFNGKAGRDSFVSCANDRNGIRLRLSAVRKDAKRDFLEESVRRRRGRKHDFPRQGRSGRKASKKGQERRRTAWKRRRDDAANAARTLQQKRVFYASGLQYDTTACRFYWLCVTPPVFSPFRFHSGDGTFRS